MGFEPRAAQRLRRAVASANGALDDVAHLLGAKPAEEKSIVAAAGVLPSARYTAFLDHP
jgi:hypothetical protein